MKINDIKEIEKMSCRQIRLKSSFVDSQRIA